MKKISKWAFESIQIGISAYTAYTTPILPPLSYEAGNKRKRKFAQSCSYEQD